MKQLAANEQGSKEGSGRCLWKSSHNSSLCEQRHILSGTLS